MLVVWIKIEAVEMQIPVKFQTCFRNRIDRASQCWIRDVCVLCVHVWRVDEGKEGVNVDSWVLLQATR